MTVEFKGGVNGKTIIDCEDAFEYEGGVNGKTIAGCDGGVNGNDIIEGADVVETLAEFEGMFLVGWRVVVNFVTSLLSFLSVIFSLKWTRFKGGLKFLSLPPNLSWPDFLLPPKPPPKQG